jgi:predicted site-specific integrase-resolvase
MKPKDIEDYFKTGYAFSKHTNMSANTLTNWIKAGYIPYASQKRIEKVTDGQLVAEWDEKELERHNNE